MNPTQPSTSQPAAAQQQGLPSGPPCPCDRCVVEGGKDSSAPAGSVQRTANPERGEGDAGKALSSKQTEQPAGVGSAKRKLTFEELFLAGRSVFIPERFSTLEMSLAADRPSPPRRDSRFDARPIDLEQAWSSPSWEEG